jgi:hypothetical protein
MAAPAPGCTTRGGGSGGGFGRSVHFGFFGGDSPRSAPAASPDGASGRVTRGGFGSIAAAFGFSGRG